MENSLLRYLSLLILFITISANEDDKSTSSLFSAIYYGDSKVNTGEPFSITCIISISDPIQWMKDGEPITKHNLRHGKDDHAFVVTESGIEGEGDKIEATISVKKALTIHEGKYQCNSLHPNYHYLKVIKVEKHVTTPQQNINYANIRPMYNPEERRVTVHRVHDDEQYNIDDYSSNTLHSQFSTTEMSPASPNYKSKKLTEYYRRESSLQPSNNDDMTTLSVDDYYTILNETRGGRRKGGGRKIQIMENISSTLDNYDLDSDETFREYTKEYFPSTSSSYPSQRGKQHLKPTSRPAIIPDDRTRVPVTVTVTQLPKTIRRDELVPNYDIPDLKVKVYDVRKPLVLNCNITSGTGKIIWKKNSTDVSEVPYLKNRYKIHEDEHNFVIDKTLQDDDGTYSCTWKEKNITQEIHVVASLHLKLPSNSGVVEGEKLSIHCNVLGTDPEIIWTIGNNLTIKETTGRYILEADDRNIKNAKLIIETVVLEDRGEITCNATNVAHKLKKYSPVSDTTLVRVKGKLAALWPFLGICAEVLILCGIILIYEKRRNKSELDESDTDQNNEQKNDQPGKESEVRELK